MVWQRLLPDSEWGTLRPRGIHGGSSDSAFWDDSACHQSFEQIEHNCADQ
jgi:hypothetical protein